MALRDPDRRPGPWLLDLVLLAGAMLGGVTSPAMCRRVAQCYATFLE